MSSMHQPEQSRSAESPISAQASSAAINPLNVSIRPEPETAPSAALERKRDTSSQAIPVPETLSFAAQLRADLKQVHKDYLAAHDRLATRVVHALGWYPAAGCIGTAAVTGNLVLIPIGLAIGYGAAISSHYIFEKNQPKSLEGLGKPIAAAKDLFAGRIGVREALSESVRGFWITGAAFVSDAVMSLALPFQLLRSARKK